MDEGREAKEMSTRLLFKDDSGALMELGPADRKDIFLSIRGPGEGEDEDRVYSLSREHALKLIAEISSWLVRP